MMLNIEQGKIIIKIERRKKRRGNINYIRLIKNQLC